MGTQLKLMAFGKKGQIDYDVEYNLPESIKAPVKQGQVVGQANLVDKQGNIVKSVDLVSVSSVQSKTYWDYVQQIVTAQ